MHIPENQDTVSDVDWAWLGGFWDGEGCFSASLGKFKKDCFEFIFSACVSNTDRDMIIRCRDIVGLGSVDEKVNRTFASPKHKAVYRYRLSAKPKLMGFVERVYPHLVGKRKRAELFYELCFLTKHTHSGAGYSKEDWEKIVAVYNEFRILNKRGTEPFVPISSDMFVPKRFRTWKKCSNEGCSRLGRNSHGECKQCRMKKNNLRMISGG